MQTTISFLGLNHQVRLPSCLKAWLRFSSITRLDRSNQYQSLLSIVIYTAWLRSHLKTCKPLPNQLSGRKESLYHHEEKFTHRPHYFAICDNYITDGKRLLQLLNSAGATSEKHTTRINGIIIIFNTSHIVSTHLSKYNVQLHIWADEQGLVFIFYVCSGSGNKKIFG